MRAETWNRLHPDQQIYTGERAYKRSRSLRRYGFRALKLEDVCRAVNLDISPRSSLDPNRRFHFIWDRHTAKY